jgi:hypothetical protein
MQVIGIEVEQLRTLIREETTAAIQQQLTPKEPETIAIQEWIATPVFKMVLRNKGYSSKSSFTLRQIVKNHKIRTEKRGRDIWYNVSDVDNIPSKLSK